jgi:hypothetical protein
MSSRAESVRVRMDIFAALEQRIATLNQIVPTDLGESAEYPRHIRH